MGGFNRVSNLSVQEQPNDSKDLSDGKVAGIVVGSVVGGLLLLILLALLIRCLCLRRKVNSSTQETKPGSTSETKRPRKSSSVWNCFRKRELAMGASSKRAPPPIFGSDKLDPDEISDTSFVLPELGGPNPHNKFDGMEWVDIKGMDDDVLVDISTDLRRYQQRQ